MKRRKKSRKVVTAVMLAVTAMSLAVAGTACSPAQEGQKYCVALGDSITAGYGLAEGEDNCATLFAAGMDMALTNLAVSGQTAAELSAALGSGSSGYAEYLAALQTADVVTITIGGNDLMAAFYSFVAELMGDGYTAESVYGILADPSANLLSALSIFLKLNGTDYSSALAQSDVFMAAVAECVEDINIIAAKIKDVNSDAVVIIANQYNPYKWISGYDNIVNLFETGVTYYNTQFADGAADGYIIADVYSAFDASEEVLTNAEVDMSASVYNFDFHPDAAGHRVIAGVMEEAYSAV